VESGVTVHELAGDMGKASCLSDGQNLPAFVNGKTRRMAVPSMHPVARPIQQAPVRGGVQGGAADAAARTKRSAFVQNGPRFLRRSGAAHTLDRQEVV